MVNIAKYRPPKVFKKILVLLLRQKYEEYESVTFNQKKVKPGVLLARDKKVNIISKLASNSLLVSLSS